PLFSLLIVYAFFVLVMSQVLVILRVRFPKSPVRLITGAILILSLVPAAALADPAFPIRFAELPLPSSVFAVLGLAVLRGTPWPLAEVVLALGYTGGIALAWYALSKTYIVHGLRPTMSAGFGQVRMGPRMEIQRHVPRRPGGGTPPRPHGQLRDDRPRGECAVLRPPDGDAIVPLPGRKRGGLDRVADRGRVRGRGAPHADQAEAVRPVVRGTRHLFLRVLGRHP